VRTWPAIRAGLEGLGLNTKPIHKCRQCILKLPGDARAADVLTG
jgi:hypothetical protein